MFTLRVTVPNITRAQVAELEATIPGFSTVATVPIIETAEQAITAARAVGEKRLASREFISSKDTKAIKTDTGWKIEFICYGD